MWCTFAIWSPFLYLKFNNLCALYARCWRSGTFPLCDGSHVKHNKATGDNVGPLLLKKQKEWLCLSFFSIVYFLLPCKTFYSGNSHCLFMTKSASSGLGWFPYFSDFLNRTFAVRQYQICTCWHSLLHFLSRCSEHFSIEWHKASWLIFWIMLMSNN